MYHLPAKYKKGHLSLCAVCSGSRFQDTLALPRSTKMAFKKGGASLSFCSPTTTVTNTQCTLRALLCLHIFRVIGCLCEGRESTKTWIHQESGRPHDQTFFFSYSLIELEFTYDITLGWRHIVRWLDTLIYCKMMSTIASAGTYIMSHSYPFFLMVRTFEIYPPRNRSAHHIVLSTVNTRLHVRSAECIHPNWEFVLFDHHLPFPPLP